MYFFAGYTYKFHFMTRMHMTAINGTANSMATKIQRDFPLCKAEKRPFTPP